MSTYQQTIQKAIDHVSKGGKILLKQRCAGKKVMFYKLDENKNVIKSSIEEWQSFIEEKLPSNYWIVGKDEVNNHEISTVFIGLCHNFNPNNGVPIVFETMVFHKQKSVYQRRYSTWQEAEEGHKEAVAWVINGCKENEC